MLLNENRNCGCNNVDNNDEDKGRRINCERKEELLQKIRCYEFAINELALYLDTHPEDKKALCLHKKYCNEYKSYYIFFHILIFITIYSLIY